MTKTSVAEEILQIRTRLREIDDNRITLEPTDFTTRADLLDEEHELQAELAQLTERARSEDHELAVEHAAAGIDLTRSPKLPDSRT